MAKKFKVKVNGKEYIVEVEEIRERRSAPRVTIEAPKAPVEAKPSPKVEEKLVEKPVQPEVRAGEKVVRAPMGGVVMKVLVKVGDEVKSGDTVIVFEAMKMENELKSPYSGKVKEVKVKEGEMMETGQVVVVLE